MSFGDIEEILGFPLPDSARKYRPWWANQSDGAHVQSKTWMRAGWRVGSVDLATERVEFLRAAAVKAEGMSEATATPFQSHEPTARRAALVTFDRAKLSIGAHRILDDYTAEFGGNVQKAVDRALCEARIAFKKRLLDCIPRDAPSSVSSVDLIREDRDAR